MSKKELTVTEYFAHQYLGLYSEETVSYYDSELGDYRKCKCGSTHFVEDIELVSEIDDPKVYHGYGLATCHECGKVYRLREIDNS